MLNLLKGLLTLAVGALADKGWFPMELFFFCCSVGKIFVIHIVDKCSEQEMSVTKNVTNIKISSPKLS